MRHTTIGELDLAATAIAAVILVSSAATFGKGGRLMSVLRASAKSLALAIPPVRRLYDAVLEANAENAVLRKSFEGAVREREALADRVTAARIENTGLSRRIAELDDDIRGLEEKSRQQAPINYNFRKLQLLITNRCDFTCVMCNIIHEHKATLSEAAVRSLIEDADELGFDEVEISGGEPYYLPYFKSVIEEYGGTIRPVLKICTNGYSLDRALIDRLAGRNRLQFQVSFDGTHDIHNQIRVQGRYDAFTKSDQNFRALAEAGLMVSLNTVIQRHNVGNILETYEHFRDVDYLYHGFGIVEDNSWDYAKNRLVPEQIDELAAELETLLDESKADGKNVGINDNMVQHIRSMKRGGDERHGADFAMHAGYGCTVPFSTVIVRPNGEVVPCFHAPWADATMFNMEEERLKDILHSPRYIERSRRMVQIDGCEGCTTACYFRRRQPKLVHSNRRKTGLGKTVAGRPVVSVA